jgi:hypothetical protein
MISLFAEGEMGEDDEIGVRKIGGRARTPLRAAVGLRTCGGQRTVRPTFYRFLL